MQDKETQVSGEILCKSANEKQCLDRMVCEWQMIQKMEKSSTLFAEIQIFFWWEVCTPSKQFNISMPKISPMRWKAKAIYFWGLIQMWPEFCENYLSRETLALIKILSKTAKLC